jgi:hypothetical protein
MFACVWRVNTQGRFGCQGRYFLSRVPCQDFRDIWKSYAEQVDQDVQGALESPYRGRSYLGKRRRIEGRVFKFLFWSVSISGMRFILTGWVYDEIKATPSANIWVPPWPPPFTIRGGHGVVAVWKMNLSRWRLKCKKGRMMRTSLLWIQPRLFVGVGVRLVFRLQESTYLQQLSRLHMDSNLAVLLLHGKITKSTLKRIQPHVDTLSESVTITDLYRDVFCQRWVCSYMLLMMILRIDCYLIMLWWLGTMEEIRKGLKRDVEVQRSSKGSQAKLESQSKSSWNPIRIPGTVHTKFVAQITYQLRFGRSLYGWKDKRINFPMELVWYPNSFWVHGKRRNNEVHRICHGAVLPYLGPVGYVSSWAQ